ncbi:MAG: universal stress protein [Candidatus Obscuribacterales bacterium]
MSEATMKLLLPVDVTQTHDDLVDHISWLLPIASCDVIVLFVKEILPSYEQLLESMGDFPEDLNHQMEDKARTVLGALESELKGRARSTKVEIVSGPTAWMINEVAKDHGIDLTVVTPGPDARVRRYLMGSTSSHVVKHTQSDVLVLRDDPRHDKLTSVVIALDGSQDSLNAMSRSVELLGLKERKVDITLTSVVNIAAALKVISPVTFLAALEDNLMMEGEAMLAAAAASLDKEGVSGVATRLKNGDPAGEIIAVAEKHKAQLIVTGAKGRGAVAQMVMGSVSDRVSSHASCSTLVVKGGAS